MVTHSIKTLQIVHIKKKRTGEQDGYEKWRSGKGCSLGPGDDEGAEVRLAGIHSNGHKGLTGYMRSGFLLMGMEIILLRKKRD